MTDWRKEILSVKQIASLAARMRVTIEGSFAHWEAVPELDLDAAFDGYLAEALAAPSRLAQALAGHRLMALLGNGNSGYHDSVVHARSGGSYGVYVRPVAGQWAAALTRRDDVSLGSQVVALDDEPMDIVFARLRPFIAASSDRQAADKLMFNRYLLPDKIALTFSDGTRTSLSKGSLPSPTVESPAVRHFGKIAYLKVTSFGDPRIETAAVEAVAALERNVPLIIDIRGNGGGSTPQSLVSVLMDRPYRYWRSTWLRWTTLGRALGQTPEVVAREAEYHEPLPDSHRGPIALLVDGLTISAAEDFAMPFKDNGRAVLIGETTAGSSGQPHMFDFACGISLRVGAKRETFPDGSRFEGVGITPDREIVTTAEDLRSGRDRALEAALALLS